MSMNTQTISTLQDIEAFTEMHPEWSFNDDSLQATYVLDSFEDAVVAINTVAKVVSEADHHPTIENTYNKLSFTLTTHDAGDKVTALDISVAKQISEVMND